MVLIKLCLSLNLLYLAQTSVIKSELNLAHEKLIYDVNNAETLFKEFIVEFSKKYKDENEYKNRLEIFKRNLIDINKNNKLNTGVIYGITVFSDISYEEFVSKYTGFRMEGLKNNITKLNFILPQYGDVPDQWDWREKGLVGGVRNQGDCSSCWAFASTGVVYGQLAKKHGKQILLSNQQLVDCFLQGGGCRTGSYPHLAFRAAEQMGGFMSEANYPYKGRQGRCQFRTDRIVVKVKGGHVVDVHDEEHLKMLVYQYGPVAIGLFVGPGWLRYRGGIGNPATLTCNSRQPGNHAVIIIGYGVENGVPYWIIQNSAGQGWGERGYIRLVRGQNTCNLLGYAAIADIE